MAILEIRNLTKYFGGLAAVNDISFQLEKGEILGLIGPNGAGKTTLFNVISGVYKPTAGKVTYKGEDITGHAVHTITKKGISRTFQLTSLFKESSVLDNVLTGFHLRSKAGFWRTLANTPYSRREEGKIKQEALEILRFMGLAHLKDEPAKNLPQGVQRALSLAIALAPNPEVLLLDEPVTGMNTEETEIQLGKIGMLSGESGKAILLIEHNMQAVMSLCGRIVVMSFGEKIAEGAPEEIRADPVVIEAYLGTPQYDT